MAEKKKAVCGFCKRNFYRSEVVEHITQCPEHPLMEKTKENTKLLNDLVSVVAQNTELKADVAHLKAGLMEVVQYMYKELNQNDVPRWGVVIQIMKDISPDIKKEIELIPESVHW